MDMAQASSFSGVNCREAEWKSMKMKMNQKSTKGEPVVGCAWTAVDRAPGALAGLEFSSRIQNCIVGPVARTSSSLRPSYEMERFVYFQA